ncbi:MAG: beta-galactosidase [Anaerolineae bacterium]|jgi:beta-galactosidase|nr:beta-galactosidase [Anaerolineae bacterium]
MGDQYEKLYYGADYYPEHWPQERWSTDAEMMQAAGMNVVRMAEFAWTRMETKPGEFTFGWLDKAIEILAAHGIQTVLGTPTASPPAWLMNSDESMYLVTEEGVRRTYGNRREYCPTHAGYRQASDRICTAMALYYADNPNVIGFQTDNEFGDNCFCPLCRQGFQHWLKEKYGSLDALNTAWGTEFWSHTYQQWEEIPAMLSIANKHNPGLELDWKRFMSDTYVDFQQRQIDILRQHAPGKFITHNLMGFGYDKINYFDLTENLDFTSWDNYVRVFWEDCSQLDMSRFALGHDTMRGTKKAPYWVMEQQSGPTGWSSIAETPRPGELRAWAYQSIAHGADGVVYFRWRTCRTGTEEYWHGILDHHGEPTRRYRELAAMGQELSRISAAFKGAMPKAEVAMMLSYDVRFGFQSQPNNLHFSYPAHFTDIYRAFWQENIAVDMISEKETQLSEYKLVVLPAFYVLSEETKTAIEVYVKNGGTVLFTARSGVKGMANEVVDLRLPGLLREMCGVRVEEYDSMKPDMHNTVQFAINGKSVQVKLWAEWLEPEGASVLATYSDDYFAGQAAVTVNDFGAGKAVYAGVWGNTEFFRILNQWLLPVAGVNSIHAPTGVEICKRYKDGKTFTFIINFNKTETPVMLKQKAVDLLTGKLVSGQVVMPPQEVMILVEN